MNLVVVLKGEDGGTDKLRVACEILPCCEISSTCEIFCVCIYLN